MSTLTEFLRDSSRNEYWRVNLTNEHEDVNLGAAARIKDPLFTAGRQWQLNRFRAFNGGRLIEAVVQRAEIKIQKAEDRIPLEYTLNDSSADDDLTQLPNSWDTNKLRYEGSIKNDNSSVELTFQDLKGDDFDWYNFKLMRASDGELKNEKTTVRQFTYKGQAEKRWWSFEDSRVNIDAIVRPYINPLTMLLMGTLQSSASYRSYTVPVAVQPGSVVVLQGLKVKDSFGKEKEYSNNSSVFNHHEGGDEAVFFYPDTLLAHTLRSEVIEELQLSIDHFSNVVWGIEKCYLDDKGFPTRSNDKNVKTGKEFVHQIKDVARTPMYMSEAKNHVSTLQPTDNSEALYLNQLRVLSYIPINAFPFIRKDQKLMLGKVVKSSAYSTSFLQEMQELDSSYLPEYATKLTKRYYLAFNANKVPFLWVGIQQRLSEKAFPVAVMFDQI